MVRMMSCKRKLLFYVTFDPAYLSHQNRNVPSALGLFVLTSFTSNG